MAKFCFQLLAKHLSRSFGRRQVGCCGQAIITYNWDCFNPLLSPSILQMKCKLTTYQFKSNEVQFVPSHPSLSTGLPSLETQIKDKSARGKAIQR